jgi:hypothetical protein
MRQLPLLPSIHAIEDAPERTVLSVLHVCATNAERILLSRNPDMLEFRDLQRPEPPDTAPPLTIASRHLLGRIAELKDTLALYESALRADRLSQAYDDDCDPF